MSRTFTEKQKIKQGKLLCDSLFDARRKGSFGIMKPTIYKRMIKGLKDYKERQNDLRTKVENETQDYLEKVILTKYNINKEWHIHLHTTKRR